MLRGFPKRPALRNTRPHGLSVASYGLIRYEWSIPVSPRTYCCSVSRFVVNTALPSVQRRFIACSIPHGLHQQVSSSVIRTVGVATVRPLHRSSQPKQLFSEAVDDEPCLTVQNPADVVGETVIDCRPSALPVSIPLLGLGPGIMAEARPSEDLRPLKETGKSIMNMDTNKITISQIVGFEWDEPGTDLEDEGPTAVAPPVEVVTDPFSHGDNFDFDLAKVMCDVSVIPSIITPIEEPEVQPPSRAAEYAAPATTAFEYVVESPGYTVPEDSGLAWIQGFAPVTETVLDEEDGHWLSLKDPPPLPVPTLAATPIVFPIVEGPAVPTMPPTPDDMRIKSGTGGV